MGLRHVPDHVPARNQSAAAGFFDLQNLQYPAAEFALHLLDSSRRRTGRRSVPPGAPIVAPRLASHFLHYLAKNLAAMGSRQIGAKRENHLVFMHTRTNRPVNVLVPDQELNTLRT